MNKRPTEERRSGVLLPLFSLPGEYGIGTMGREAYWFAQTIKESGFTLWQLLPLNPIYHPWCPYQPYSTFAGSELYISPEILFEQDLLTRQQLDDCSRFKVAPKNQIFYYQVYKNIHQILKVAFENFKKNKNLLEKFQNYCETQQWWLEDFCLFVAIFRLNNHQPVEKWSTELRRRDKTALENFSQINYEKIQYEKFIQFVFHEQWNKLKTFCNQLGILLIGDIPFYVSHNSADVWANAKMFTVNDDLIPYEISGVPPDYFNSNGQLWGTPLYCWHEQKDMLFDWWYKRLLHALGQYDVVRLDHFRAFADYWSVKGGSVTAAHGEFKKGPGYEFFKYMHEKFGSYIPIIVEDLGFLTQEAFDFISQCSYPKMKVLQFAFDSNPDNMHLPHNYSPNNVVYTGTHDNNTLLGWYKFELNKKQKKFLKQYLGLKISFKWHRELIRLALSSTAKWAIIPYQDLIRLGHKARINVPGTSDGNWIWKLKSKVECQKKLYSHLNYIYGRIK